MAGSYLASFNTDRCRRSSEYSFFGINKDPAYSAQVYSLGVSCFFAPGIFRYLHREHQRCRCTVVGSPQHLEYCFHYYHFSLLVKLVGYWTPMLEDGFFVSTTDGRRNNLEVRVWSRQWPCIYSPGYPLGVSWFAQQIHFIVCILTSKATAVLKFDTLDILLFSLQFDCRTGWVLSNDARGLVCHTWVVPITDVDEEMISDRLWRQQNLESIAEVFPLGYS